MASNSLLYHHNSQALSDALGPNSLAIATERQIQASRATEPAFTADGRLPPLPPAAKDPSLCRALQNCRLSLIRVEAQLPCKLNHANLGFGLSPNPRSFPLKRAPNARSYYPIPKTCATQLAIRNKITDLPRENVEPVSARRGDLCSLG